MTTLTGHAGAEIGSPHARSGDAAVVLCTHCALPVPSGLLEPRAATQFCCEGCRTVYAILHGCGLDRYYDVLSATGRRAERPAPTGREYSELDDPDFAREHVARGDDGLCRATLLLAGVHCGACVWLVERLPRIVPGVIEARVDLRRARVQLVWESSVLPLSSIARTLDRLGYAPHPPTGAGDDALRVREDRAQVMRLGIAGALAGNAMLLALAMYGGLFDGIADEHLALFRWVSAGIGLVSLAWPGRVFFRGAWGALRARAPHLDLPIALALAAGGVIGLINAVSGSGEVYFDSLTALVFLLLVGRFLQHRQQRAAHDAVALLFTLTPSHATRIERDHSGAEMRRDVPARALSTGDLIEVRPGQTVPADGELEACGSDFDTSVLTGESAPAPRAAGESVFAGEINRSRTVRVRVRAAGEATRAGRLMELVSDALSQRPALVQLADRLGAGFVLAVVIVALLTLLVWWPAGAAVAMGHATALLVVSCPCALGLATPLVYAATLGRLARRGILVKGGCALERLARPGLLVLDKTGTLTEGQLGLESWWGDDRARGDVLAIERRVEHPVARALVHGLTAKGVCATEGPVDDLTYAPGYGVSARIRASTYRVGAAVWLDARGVQTPPSAQAWIRAQVELGRTVVLVERDGAIVAGASLGDAPHADAREALAALRRAGWRTSVLSGDRQDVVGALAHRLGGGFEETLGARAPEDKLQWIRTRLDPARALVMVGDGVNDAAALAAADVGVAVSGGAEASLRAADVSIRARGLWPLVQLTRAARAAQRRVLACLAVSAVYNVLGAGAAVAGLVSPLTAAVLMPLSSMTVLAIASWSRVGEGSSWR